jgi:hypothetical protein
MCQEHSCQIQEWAIVLRFENGWPCGESFQFPPNYVWVKILMRRRRQWQRVGRGFGICMETITIGAVRTSKPLSSLQSLLGGRYLEGLVESSYSELSNLSQPLSRLFWKSLAAISITAITAALHRRKHPTSLGGSILPSTTFRDLL